MSKTAIPATVAVPVKSLLDASEVLEGMARRAGLLALVFGAENDLSERDQQAVHDMLRAIEDECDGLTNKLMTPVRAVARGDAAKEAEVVQ